MNLIRNILLLILFLQFLIFLYVKLIYEATPIKTLLPLSVNIQEQVATKTFIPKKYTKIKLPQSSKYTVWNKKTVVKLKKELQDTTPLKKPIKIVKIVKKESINKKIIQKIATYAKKKLGNKYVWGATGPKTFDCSGFTRAVFHSTTGIKIPRVSREQAKVGKYIKYKELRAGDMVFFDTEKKYSGKVNHVGIYLKNGNFIHASSAKKKVIISSFKKKPFYKKRFLWGRRMVQNQS
jgi:cell wall-associated NlpC family hydrolase